MSNFCCILSKSQRTAIVRKSSQEGNKSEADTNITSKLSNTSNTESVNGQILEVPNLRIYTLNELRTATRNFKPNLIIGRGGFGTVYKGWLDNSTLNLMKTGKGTVVAVRKPNLECTHKLEQRQAEVNFFGRISHPNVLKLLGCCMKDRELLIVYEYMANGSLEDHLFGKLGTDPQPLSWNMRLKILIGAARGLAFLHSSKQFIHRDIKPSKILLDSDYNPKLSDSGIAQIGPMEEDCEMSTEVMGSFPYTAPECLDGHLHVKSDVYGFGVVLLEMLSGSKVVNLIRPSAKQNLTEWADLYLLDGKNLLKLVMDKSLEGEYNPKAAIQAAKLTVHCLAANPRERPSMDQVVDILQNVKSIALFESLKLDKPSYAESI